MTEEVKKEYKDITSKNFKDLIKENNVILISFGAPWCGPCQQLAPILNEVTKELEGKVLVGKVNTDEEVDLAREYRIMSVPTTFILKKGVLVGQPKIGSVSKKELLDMCSEHI